MRAISELDKIDKPREKLVEKGVSALKDYELIAIMLGSGIRGKDVLTLSQDILTKLQDDFHNISLEKLLEIHGLGLAKASTLLSAIELSKRYLIKQKSRKITFAKDAYHELLTYADKKQEHFIAMTLDGANYIIEKRVITIGTLNQSLVHPREVFADAITDRAASVIIAHNHPSGQLHPSHEDMLVTERLKKAATILGIDLLDHLIITGEGFYSFKNEGKLI